VVAITQALADAAVAQWDGPAADAAIAQLDREHDNMRAALLWARDSGDRMLGLLLAGTQKVLASLRVSERGARLAGEPAGAR
jgi:hypothetical protein